MLQLHLLLPKQSKKTTFIFFRQKIAVLKFLDEKLMKFRALNW